MSVLNVGDYVMKCAVSFSEKSDDKKILDVVERCDCGGYYTYRLRGSSMFYSWSELQNRGYMKP